MKRVCLLAAVAMLVTGCTSSMPIKNYALAKDVRAVLEEDIKIYESTDSDVRELLGDPQIISYYEASSFERQLSKIPLLEQLTNSIKRDMAPQMSWIYIYPINDKDVKEKRTIQVLGVDVYYKDIRIVNIFFNNSGKVLGYSITAHSIQ